MRKAAGLLWALALAVRPLFAQMPLSEGAQVSLLTCSPSQEAAFTVYGHTAIRVAYDANTDLVFNYGVFDFDTPHFIYRFAKGETDYRLAVGRFADFIAEYQMRGSGVTEQLLNLTQQEKDNLWQALLTNARPDNASYRYNFFFDNCATRPAAMVERCLNGAVIYPHRPQPPTFRQMINDCMRQKPWLVFGCDLALGSPADRPPTPHEEIFLPLRLEASFADAIVRSPDGHERPLVAHTRQLAEPFPAEAERTVFTPLLCALALLAIVAGVTCWEWRRRTYCRWLDCLLFFAAGTAGALLCFLVFASAHPATHPNWQLLWLHPLHLAGAVCCVVKRLHIAAHYYRLANFALLTFMPIACPFLPQHFNTAIFPFAACLWLRSATFFLPKAK